MPLDVTTAPDAWTPTIGGSTSDAMRSTVDPQRRLR